MIIRNLEGISITSILATFNESFSDYFVPINLSKELLTQKMMVERIRLNHSVGVFDEEQLIALILCGIDEMEGKKIAYNGGTGVIPAYRGKGLTGKMYEKLFEIYKTEKVQQALLEVIDENNAAIRAYEKVGFKTLRSLDCVKGQIKFNKPESKIAVTPREIKHPDWSTLTSFWNWKPTWPYSIGAIQRAVGTQNFLGLFQEDLLLAYGIINLQSGRIAQFAVHPSYRKQGLGKLLFYYLGKLGNPKLSIINIDKQDNASIDFLKDIGFKSYIGQLEMGMDL